MARKNGSRILFIIPARGGSKGLPGKNIKLLHGKPLLHYSIDYARLFADDKDILVSTEDASIAACAASAGLEIPFLRPAKLAGDETGMSEVLLHALNMFADHNDIYESIVLLQPTSPLRRKDHLQHALSLYNSDIDMIVSVCESKANPYFNLYEEDEDGFLSISKRSGVSARQKAPPVYLFNGSIYIINAASLISYQSISDFRKVRKFVMEKEFSVDIDDATDWLFAEAVMGKNFGAGS